jgi:hypothetical protein
MSLGRRLAALENALPLRPTLHTAKDWTNAEIAQLRVWEAVSIAYWLGDAGLAPIQRFYSGIAAGNASSDNSQPYRASLRSRMLWASFKIENPGPHKRRDWKTCLREIPEQEFEDLAASLANTLIQTHPELLDWSGGYDWTIEATPDGRIISNYKDPETAFEITGDVAAAFGPQRAGGATPC